MQHSVSLDEAVADDSHRTAAETAADENMPSPPEQINAGETIDHLASAIRGLPEREQTILRLRFGLEDGCERKLDEIGEVVGLNRERVRQLQADALEKLRRQMRKLDVTR
jgi:RNA polymerase primary sigma factor